MGISALFPIPTRRRTVELAIRLALGADREQVFRRVLAEGLWLALVGISIGLVVSVLLTGFLKFFLCGVSATDVLTFAAVGVLLLSCSAPCFVPARRATRVDPMVALHYEVIWVCRRPSSLATTRAVPAVSEIGLTQFFSPQVKP